MQQWKHIGVLLPEMPSAMEVTGTFRLFHLWEELQMPSGAWERFLDHGASVSL